MLVGISWSRCVSEIPDARRTAAGLFGPGVTACVSFGRNARRSLLPLAPLTNSKLHALEKNAHAALRSKAIHVQKYALRGDAKRAADIAQ
jgi:hypothetical protein